MAESEPIKQIPPQHEDIVRSTWSQLLGAEGNVQNLAVDLFKSLVKTQMGNTSDESTSRPQESGKAEGQSGQGDSQGGGGSGAGTGDYQGGGVSGGGNDDLFKQLGGLAGQFLGTRRDQGNPEGGGGGGNNDMMQQLGGLAGQFLGGRQGQNQNQSGNVDSGTPDSSNRSGGGGGGGGGGGNLMDTSGGLGSLARQFGGGGSGGGSGNIMSMIGSLGGLAALANGLHDPGSLLSFFQKTPVAKDAANPDNSSRDIYKIIKNIIFSLLGSKLPAEDFNQNTENKSAWKGYLGVIAKALRGMTGS